jgi:hypothetical protein
MGPRKPKGALPCEHAWEAASKLCNAIANAPASESRKTPTADRTAQKGGKAMLPLKCMKRGSNGTAYALKKRLCTKLDFWGLFITSFLTLALFSLWPFSHFGPFRPSPHCPENQKPLVLRGLRKNGAGRGNRTLLASLEGWSFTTKLYPLCVYQSDRPSFSRNTPRLTSRKNREIRISRSLPPISPAFLNTLPRPNAGPNAVRAPFKVLCLRLSQLPISSYPPYF